MWQDWYFALSGAVYSAVLIPSLLDPKTEVPRSSSLPTATMMALSAGAYASLGLAWAAVLSAVGVVPWLLLARYRPIRPRVVEVDGVVRVTMQLSEEEGRVVEQYRNWVVAQQMLAAETQAAHEVKLAGGGCGGCPSKGGCSEAEA